MGYQFSFIGNNIENILRNREVFLPGIARIESIYCMDAAQQGLNYLSLDKEGNVQSIGDLEIDKTEFNVSAQKLRSGESNSAWLQQDELPYSIRNTRNGNPTIFNEFDRTVLMLRYRSPYDQRFDLLLIYFNKNLTSFGIRLVNNDLSIENKNIIAHLLYHYFRYIMALNNQNFEILRMINESTKSLINQNKAITDEVENAREIIADGIISLSVQYLKAISHEQGRNYILAEDAVEKIKTFRGNFSSLEAIIRRAVIFHENLHYDQLEEPVNLHAYHINLSEPTPPAVEEKINRLDSKKSKTIMLLDKLEKACSVVKQRNLPLTGANIGLACPIPISAPAITDALKKHKKMILSLFDQFQDRWKLIRSEFKPVINLSVTRVVLEEKE